jgi:hypothetical protein
MVLLTLEKDSFSEVVPLVMSKWNTIKCANNAKWKYVLRICNLGAE